MSFQSNTRVEERSDDVLRMSLCVVVDSASLFDRRINVSSSMYAMNMLMPDIVCNGVTVYWCGSNHHTFTNMVAFEHHLSSCALASNTSEPGTCCYEFDMVFRNYEPVRLFYMLEPVVNLFIGGFESLHNKVYEIFAYSDTIPNLVTLYTRNYDRPHNDFVAIRFVARLLMYIYTHGEYDREKTIEIQLGILRSVYPRIQFRLLRAYAVAAMKFKESDDRSEYKPVYLRTVHYDGGKLFIFAVWWFSTYNDNPGVCALNLSESNSQCFTYGLRGSDTDPVKFVTAVSVITGCSEKYANEILDDARIKANYFMELYNTNDY